MYIIDCFSLFLIIRDRTIFIIGVRIESTCEIILSLQLGLFIIVDYWKIGYCSKNGVC